MALLDDMAMGQPPVPLVNIPIPTKIDLKMVPLVLTHSHMSTAC